MDLVGLITEDYNLAKKLKFHLHGFSHRRTKSSKTEKGGLNSTYMDLVLGQLDSIGGSIDWFKFHLYGFSLFIVLSYI